MKTISKCHENPVIPQFTSPLVPKNKSDINRMTTQIQVRRNKKFWVVDRNNVNRDEVIWWFTYINGHYNPSVRIIDLVSFTTCVVWRELQFKFDSEWQIFLRNSSWQFYLLSEFLPEIGWAEIAKKILFVICFDVWPGAWILALRLISQHTTY